MVKLALEGSDGVVDFKLGLANARVKFDPKQINEETLITNIKKKTRYSDVFISEDNLIIEE